MNVKLIVRGGKLAGKEIAIKTNQFLIGRDESCNLRPNSNVVSKIHCAIVISDDSVWLRDMKSTNGTFRNGERVVDRVELQNGDEIRVGPLVFEVIMPEAKPKATPVEEAAPAPTKRKETKSSSRKVDDDDVFEWLSEDEEAMEISTDSDPQNSDQQQTVLDLSLSQTETVHDLKEEPAKSQAPAKSDAGTTSAAANALKGLMSRKRA